MFNSETARLAGSRKSVKKTFANGLKTIKTGEYSRKTFEIIKAAEGIPDAKTFVEGIFRNIEQFEKEVQAHPDARALIMLIGAKVKIFEIIFKNLPPGIIINGSGTDIASLIISAVLKKSEEGEAQNGEFITDEDDDETQLANADEGISSDEGDVAVRSWEEQKDSASIVQDEDSDKHLAFEQEQRRASPEYLKDLRTLNDVLNKSLIAERQAYEELKSCRTNQN